MAQITTKELGAISDALAVEQTLVGKYNYYSSIATDDTLKTKYEQLSNRHQHHFDVLYSHIK